MEDSKTQLIRPRNSRLVEFLEARVLLSVAPASASDGLTAAQLAHLRQAGQHLAAVSARNLTQDPLAIVSSDLAQLYSDDSTGWKLSPAQFGAIESQNGDPAISIHTRGSALILLHELEKMGLTELDVLPKYHVVDGYLPIAALPLAAKLSGVTGITAIDAPTVNSVGSAPNQADQAENVQLARSVYGLNGAGVKVGVISDSVNQVDGGLAASVASGDLSNNVTVLKDGPPGSSDEGRAMMEQIHDLAPNAALYFYTSGATQSSMVTAINALKAAGCKIIVDDVIYIDEPFFQDGVISQAINAFVASGGSYFSAAGNNSNNGYFRTGVQYTTDASGHSFVNFAPKGSTDDNLRITLGAPATLKLQWDNPYNGVTGSATSDINLLVFNYNGTKEVTSSTNNALGGIPEQTVTLSPGTYELRMQLAGVSAGATPPDMLKFIVTTPYDGGLEYVNYPGVMSTAYGHDAGQNTISVGAVAFSNAPAFSTQTPVASENFSSIGPVVYAFDANGKKLATPLTLDKPDISGVDGVNTSFFGYVTATDRTYFPQFFGTSAAAPNVAAVAALIDQLKPGTTQATILAALKYSAIPLNGAAPGAWDPQGGYGLVDAVKALSYFGNGPVAPSAQFAAIASPRSTAIASENITFNEPVTGFSLFNLELTRNGGANLLTTAQTLTSADSKTFTLANLSTLTATAGTYVLTLTAFASGIVGDGLPLAQDATLSWQTTATTASAPTASIGSMATPRATSISSETITFNQPVSGFTLANLTLSRNGGASLLTSAQTLTTTDQITYTLNNLGGLTSLAGNYTLTLKPTGIKNAAGIALAVGGAVSWQRSAVVVGRYIFYNESVFNQYSFSPSLADNAAIATDKVALLPGQTASFANISSYEHGLNGMMIDIAGMPAGGLTAADFTFKTGNNNTTSAWATGPNPYTIAVEPGAGVGGSTRIVLVWSDNNPTNPAGAIAGKWLQVTVKADAKTGLAAPDVFYFGSAIGDTGASANSAAVTASDIAAIKAHESAASVPVTNNWDLTRNGIVNSYDATIAAENETSGATALQLISPPG